MKRREAKEEIEKILAKNIVEERVFQFKPWTCYTAKAIVGKEPFFLLGFTKVRYPDVWDAEGGVNRAKKKALALCAKKIMIWFSAEYGLASGVCPWDISIEKWCDGTHTWEWYAYAAAEMEKRYGVVRFDGHADYGKRL